MSPVSLPGMHTPAAGFDQPFEMLAACHQRVRRSLALLQRLQAHLQSHGADTMAQDAARDVLRYFSVAAPAHHEDEERHVIPALQAQGDPQLKRIAQQMIDHHEVIRALWRDLESQLQALAAGSTPEPQLFERLVREFTDVHDDHLALEDGLAFPRAAALVRQRGDAALAEMGREMAERRGARLP